MAFREVRLDPRKTAEHARELDRVCAARPLKPIAAYRAPEEAPQVVTAGARDAAKAAARAPREVFGAARTPPAVGRGSPRTAPHENA